MASIVDSYSKIKSAAKESFESKQSGKVVIQIGNATCENAAGANEIRRIFSELVKVSGRNDILIKETGCTGRCSQEPIVGVFVEDEIAIKYQNVTKEKASIIFHQHVLLKEPAYQYILDKKTTNIYEYVVTFCSSKPCGMIKDSYKKTFIELLQENGIDKDIVKTYEGGCLGLCKQEDVGTHGAMMVYPEKVIYLIKSDEDLEKIVKSHFVNKKVLKDKIVENDTVSGNEFFKFYGDVSFFNKQTRIALRNCGIINPSSIEDYLFLDEYDGLFSAMKKSQEEVIQNILDSGLRGRGGGGYPTGLKWKSALENKESKIKYMVCNADEGDPGAFMDRAILEGAPFDVVNGMTIAAYAVGATKGFAYIRAEYPLAIERMQNAIDQAKKENLLGDNILGSDFSFDIEIRLGAGAFVCGEETALMASIMGERGQPVIRPPYPTEAGLWGDATVINNVETFANVPAILKGGSEWFSQIGTDTSKGTKVFALAGKVNNTGLVEVPMGTTLRDIIYSIGGGIADGKELKAIQTGGPSGGCIPASKIDTIVDYETLSKAGSMMGSGGMIALDESDCMVATAKFFLEFTQDESCGKCTPCREGTLRMLEILEKITEGKGKPEDIDKLERLSLMVQKTSLCGLGQAAPNPVLSMLEHFREEFMVHVVEKRCPTLVCQKLIIFEVIDENCIGCTLCAKRCPVNCIDGKPKKIHYINQDSCIKCGECFTACKFGAIAKK